MELNSFHDSPLRTHRARLPVDRFEVRQRVIVLLSKRRVTFQNVARTLRLKEKRQVEISPHFPTLPLAWFSNFSKRINSFGLDSRDNYYNCYDRGYILDFWKFVSSSLIEMIFEFVIRDSSSFPRIQPLVSSIPFTNSSLTCKLEFTRGNLGRKRIRIKISTSRIKLKENKNKNWKPNEEREINLPRSS